MAAVAVFSLILVLCSAAVSLILVLPVVVAAESLANHPPHAARRFWLIANLLPLAGGFVLTCVAFLSQYGDITATPHQASIRPHLCLLQLSTLPDAVFRFRLYALMASGLLVYALVRFVLSFLASRSAERLAHRLVEMNGEATSSQPPVLTTSSTDNDCYSLGVSSPVIVMTSGLREVLGGLEVEAVLAHERCHVRKRDNLLELVARLVTDSLVWLPTTHYYLHALRAAVEQTCDAESAQIHSAPVLISALMKMEAVKKARQLKLRGDLAQLRPTFPGYANPHKRISALSGEAFASVALPLRVIVGLETLALAGILVWLARPLHDTLYCAVNTLLTVLQI